MYDKRYITFRQIISWNITRGHDSVTRTGLIRFWSPGNNFHIVCSNPRDVTCRYPSMS